MTAPRLPDRDGAQVDALVADRYLDALLEAGDRHAADAPADAALDPGLREAARVLRRSLVRVHPSFRFEERLAARLADLALAQAAQAAPSVAASGGGTLVAFPGATAGAPGSGDPLLEAILAGDLDPADEAAVDRAAATGPDRRPLIVGGAAITSALSIVGVALVAWRATRPGSRGGARAAATMTRAVRAAHARRPPDLVDLAELATVGLAAAGVPGATLTGGPA